MKLSEIQQKLKAPKSNYNSFGKYKYRSAEDILEAVKPLLGDSTITLTDDVVEVGGRVYVKATAFFNEGTGEGTGSVAFAREPEEQKGMNASQITGSASSYARKYALQGLLLLDDGKDQDSIESPLETVKQRLDAKELRKVTDIEWRAVIKRFKEVGKSEDAYKTILDTYSLTEKQKKQLDDERN